MKIIEISKSVILIPLLSVYNAWVLTLVWPWFLPGTLSLPKAYGFLLVMSVALAHVMVRLYDQDEIESKTFEDILNVGLQRSLAVSLSLTITIPFTWVAHKIVWWIG